eukprot:4703-Heterococcus_DN1.PRE.1
MHQTHQHGLVAVVNIQHYGQPLTALHCSTMLLCALALLNSAHPTQLPASVSQCTRIVFVVHVAKLTSDRTNTRRTVMAS